MNRLRGANKSGFAPPLRPEGDDDTRQRRYATNDKYVPETEGRGLKSTTRSASNGGNYRDDNERRADNGPLRKAKLLNEPDRLTSPLIDFSVDAEIVQTRRPSVKGNEASINGRNTSPGAAKEHQKPAKKAKKPRTSLLNKIGLQLANVAHRLQHVSSSSDDDEVFEGSMRSNASESTNTIQNSSHNTTTPRTRAKQADVNWSEDAFNGDEERGMGNAAVDRSDPFVAIHFIGSPLLSIALLPQWYKALSLCSVVSFLWLNNSVVVSKVLHFLHLSFGTRLLWPEEYQRELATLSLGDRVILAGYSLLLLGLAFAVLRIRSTSAGKLNQLLGLLPTPVDVDDHYLINKLSALHGFDVSRVQEFRDKAEEEGDDTIDKYNEVIEQLGYWQRALNSALARPVSEGISLLQSGGSISIHNSASLVGGSDTQPHTLTSNDRMSNGLLHMASVVMGLRDPIVQPTDPSTLLLDNNIRNSNRSPSRGRRSSGDKGDDVVGVSHSSMGDGSPLVGDHSWGSGGGASGEGLSSKRQQLAASSNSRTRSRVSWFFYAAVGFDTFFWLRTLIQWVIFNTILPTTTTSDGTTNTSILSFLDHQQVAHPVLSMILGRQLLFQVRGLSHALLLWWPLHVGLPILLVGLQIAWTNILTKSSLPTTDTFEAGSKRLVLEYRRRRALHGVRQFISKYLFVRLVIEGALFATGYRLPFESWFSDTVGLSTSAFQRAVEASPGGGVAKVAVLVFMNIITRVVVNHTYATAVERCSPALHILRYNILRNTPEDDDINSSNTNDDDEGAAASPLQKILHKKSKVGKKSQQMHMSLVGNAFHNESDDEDDDAEDDSEGTTSNGAESGTTTNLSKTRIPKEPSLTSAFPSSNIHKSFDTIEADFGATFYLNPKEAARRRRVRDKSLIPFVVVVEVRRLGIRTSLSVIAMWTLQLASITVLATVIPLALLVGVHVVELFLLTGITTFMFLWVPAIVDSFAVDCFFYVGVGTTIFHQIFLESFARAGWENNRCPPLFSGIVVFSGLLAVSSGFSFLSNILRSRRRGLLSSVVFAVGLWITAVATFGQFGFQEQQRNSREASSSSNISSSPPSPLDANGNNVIADNLPYGLVLTTNLVLYMGFPLLMACLLGTAFTFMYLNGLLVRGRGGLEVFYQELFYVTFQNALLHQDDGGNCGCVESGDGGRFQCPIPVVATTSLFWRKVVVGVTHFIIVAGCLVSSWVFVSTIPIPSVDWVATLWLGAPPSTSSISLRSTSSSASPPQPSSPMVDIDVLAGIRDIYTSVSNSFVPVATVRIVLFVLFTCVAIGVMKSRIPNVYLHLVRGFGLLTGNGMLKPTSKSTTTSSAKSSVVHNKKQRTQSATPAHPAISPNESGDTFINGKNEITSNSATLRRAGGGGSVEASGSGGGTKGVGIVRSTNGDGASDFSTPISADRAMMSAPSPVYGLGGLPEGRHSSSGESRSSAVSGLANRNTTQFLSTPSQGATARDTLSRLRKHKGLF